MWSMVISYKWHIATHRQCQFSWGLWWKECMQCPGGREGVWAVGRGVQCLAKAAQSTMVPDLWRTLEGDCNNIRGEGRWALLLMSNPPKIWWFLYLMHPWGHSKYFHNVITCIVSLAVKGAKCILRFECVRISKC
jgi:hypothetical protein